MVLRKRQLILTRQLNTNAVNVYLSRLEFLFTINSPIDDLKAGSQKLNVDVFHLNTISYLCMPLGCLYIVQLKKYLHASKEKLNPVKCCQLFRVIFFCVYIHKFHLLLPYPEYFFREKLTRSYAFCSLKTIKWQIIIQAMSGILLQQIITPNLRIKQDVLVASYTEKAPVKNSISRMW